MALVLVVDDEVQVARSIARVLRRKGHDVRVAHSGLQALGMLGGVDLLLTDARMPGMSGLELIGRARALRPELRCCIMSGDASAEGMADGVAHVDDRLAKPFDHETLVALVERFSPPGTSTRPSGLPLPRVRR